MDLSEIERFVSRKWDDEIVARLVDYVRVPAKSPVFDGDWEAHGELAAVVVSAREWAAGQPIQGLSLEIVRLPGRTPVLFFEVPATGTAMGETVLMYGHLDKQPEFTGWRNDLGPWTPKYENGLLYGRGGADEGTAAPGDHELREPARTRHPGRRHGRQLRRPDGHPGPGRRDDRR